MTSKVYFDFGKQVEYDDFILDSELCDNSVENFVQNEILQAIYGKLLYKNMCLIDESGNVVAKRILSQKLTKSQLKALSLIESGYNIYIKGCAGTGKTFLLQYLEDFFPDKTIHYTAASGAATLQYEKAYTTSSFLGLGKFDKDTYTGRIRNYIDSNDIIIIDEVSLIGKKQWQWVLKCLRQNFGAAKPQIIIAGDSKQCPPIHWDEPMTKSQLRNFKKITLQEIVRQSDKLFICHLKKLRNKNLKDLPKTLDFLRKNSGNSEKQGVLIVPSRDMMDNYNELILKENQEKAICISDCSNVPASEEVGYKQLWLWKGARVILTRNKYYRNDTIYVNGDTGVVTGIRYESDDDGSGWANYDGYVVEVELDRNGKTVELYAFEKSFIKKHRITDKTGKIVQEQELERYQTFPILLSYALSVRRCQGATISKGIIHESIIDSDKAFQYTAFSRFKTTKDFYFSF